VTQGFDGTKASGVPGGRESGQDADDQCAGADDDDVGEVDDRGEFGEGVNLRREQFHAGHAVHETEKVVANLQHQHAEAEAGGDADHAHDEALAQEEPHDLAARRSEGLEHSDLPRLLHDKGDLGIHDAKGGDDHDEEEDVEHDVLLDGERGENLGALLRPGRDLEAWNGVPR